MRRPLPLFVLLHLGCASTSAPREAPRAQPPPVEAPTPPRDPTLAENDRVRAPLTETVHGVTLSDPYRALETDSPATQRWVAYQNARSEDWIRARTRPHIERRLSQLLDIGILRGAAAAGPHVLYLAQEGGRQTAVLMIATRAPQGWGAPRELLDPTRYGERAVIDWFRASPRGRYVAFGVSQNGDERSVLRVLDTTTGAVREEAIEHAKWCRLTWMPDESGFYYTRYPPRGG